MHTLFISDLHLDEQSPNMNRLFIDFLTHTATKADALYILGDLFEYWIGDDDDRDFLRPIKQGLRQLSQRIPIYCQVGNRDFLLGRRFARECGLHLIKDPHMITLYGQQILLMHGDSLCTDDTEYLRIRFWVRQAWFKWLFTRLSLAKRRQMAMNARAKSHRHKSQASLEIMDVTESAVIQHMQKYQCPTLIHGHTHRPAIHQHPSGERIVLAAWHERGNYLIWHENGQHELVYFDEV